MFNRIEKINITNKNHKKIKTLSLGEHQKVLMSTRRNRDALATIVLE